jgi:hypothetical protein
MAKKAAKRAPRAKKSSTLWIYISIAAIVIILGVVGMTLGGKSPVVTPDNSTKLDFDNDLEYLTDCIAVQGVAAADRSEELRYCPKLTTEDIEKLSLLDGVKGEVVCDSFGKTDNGNTYRGCYDFIRGCNQIFQFIDSQGDGREKKFYQIYQCEYENYYVYSHIMPPEIKVVRVDLSQETITGLVVLDSQN